MTMIPQYRELMTSLQDLMKQACQEIRNELGKVDQHNIEEKERHSLVSYVDKNAETYLVKHLSGLIPGCGFITEEDTVENNKQEYTWIIDPLDGTTNFLYGIPHFSCSVALQHHDEVVIGVIIDIMRKDTFHAIKSDGAYLNDHLLTIDSSPGFSEALVATGFPYSNGYDAVVFLGVMKEVLENARGVRRLGSAALDLAYVAAGRLGAYYETSLNPWDIAAGQLIVQEAGGVMMDFNGGNNYMTGDHIIACAPQHSKELLDIISPMRSVLS